jgi:hypothetical protein
MVTAFSSICEMNLLSSPQPCSHRRTHRIEFEFSNRARVQVFVCERHAGCVDHVENAFRVNGDFPSADLVGTTVQELAVVRAAMPLLVPATAQ